MDEEIQELILSLYDDGLLEPPSAPKSRVSNRLWKCLGSVALFSIAIFFFIFDFPFYQTKKSPEIVPLPTYERSFWTMSDLSAQEPVTEEVISHLEVLHNEEMRREAFKTIQTEIAALLESPYPVESARLQQVVDRIYRADLAYTESLPKKDLPFCALVERREHYDKIAETKRGLEERLSKVQEASTLFELDEIVQNTAALFEEWQASFDIKDHREKLYGLSLETIEKIAAAYSYTTRENAQKEREALWSLHTLLPKNLSTFDQILSSHSERLFMEKIELPQNDNLLAFSIKRQIETDSY